MNDLFRAIFGVPYFDHHVNRMDKTPPTDDENEDRENFRRNVIEDEDEDIGAVDVRVQPRGGIFGFPLFTDPIEIHKHFDRLVEEMNKAFGIFGFNNETNISWGDENRNINPPEEGQEYSLRDAYLKQPDCGCQTMRPRDDFDTVMGSFEPGTSREPNLEINIPTPKVYSKSVYIQTVQRPDGTVETIKKVRDHKGNEETTTTITHNNVNDPLPPPLQDNQNVAPKEDSSGMSIFKKFFPF